MKNQKNCLITSVLASSIAVVFCLQLPLAVQAEADGGSSNEDLALDMAQPCSGARSTLPSQSTTLYGGISKRHQLLDANAIHDQAQDNNASTLQAETALNDTDDVYKLAVQKLSNRQKLSSDEYRSLGVGCVGFEYTRGFFQKTGRVTAVYQNSPADKAGIRTGDKVLESTNDDKVRPNLLHALWQVTLGQEGTAVNVTLQRHSDPITVTLIRINIEDIQEARVRHEWEQMVRNLGYPKEGTFTGQSLSSLGR